ncbi:MAG: SET domain-containing protein [Verrucomicrobia bacterium]|nr:SET domain-containing protein [Verrucomicrobiota bacterium]
MSAGDVETRPSPIAGQGLFARRDFGVAERLAPYRGPLTSAPPAREESGEVYALEVAPGLWLDGAGADNPARWANHSCAPNAELVWLGATEGAWLISLRPLRAGEEITFDYGFSLAESLFHPCSCRAPGCVGRIIAAPLRPALRRHLRFSRPRD